MHAQIPMNLDDEGFVESTCRLGARCGFDTTAVYNLMCYKLQKNISDRHTYIVYYICYGNKGVPIYI